MDDCDLSAADRSAIEEAEKLAQGTHWEILGLMGEPTATDVKRAYFAVSKRYHPDRYFGKRLGPYRARLEALFVRAKKAHDVLVDDEQRKQYAAKYPAPQPPREPTPEEIAREKRLEERRKQIAGERSAKRKEGLKTELLGLKVRKLASNARAALDSGDLEAARSAVESLSAENPDDKETLFLSGQLLEKQGKRVQALARYRAARELDATDADVTKAIQRLTGRE
ncbi:MAG: DnaJ domain-containing protein [Myxococcota bacterium]|nr:DnaJ domain-containing protein [Myxococcota bacterium]